MIMMINFLRNGWPRIDAKLYFQLVPFVRDSYHFETLIHCNQVRIHWMLLLHEKWIVLPLFKFSFHLLKTYIFSSNIFSYFNILDKTFIKHKQVALCNLQMQSSNDITFMMKGRNHTRICKFFYLCICKRVHSTKKI